MLLLKNLALLCAAALQRVVTKDLCLTYALLSWTNGGTCKSWPNNWKHVPVKFMHKGVKNQTFREKPEVLILKFLSKRNVKILMFTYHCEIDAKRFNHQSLLWEMAKDWLPSASGEALRLAKATFWAAAPRGPPLPWPALPCATQKGCNTTPSNPLP